MKRPNLFAAALGIILVSGGCGGSDAPATAADPARPSGAASGAAASAVPTTGNVVEVKMMSAPGQGEVFEPADFTVKRGDVVRFVLVSGVHNANFVANRNPSGVKLPATSPYLQAPGQTYEFVVEQPNGEYYYQCDPHVAMGMIGHMTVTD
jgi:plastocyanin